jgi:Glycosyl hydrolase family 79 C-terminal beta domain
VALGAALALGGCGAGAGVRAAGSAAGRVLTVERTPDGPRLPGGFLGLSVKYRDLINYVGASPAAPNPVFLQLVRNLSPGQRPVIRIGGDSTDWTWWPVPHMARPGGVRFDLTPAWTAVARAVATALGAQLIVGINFEADSRRVASTEASRIVAGVGRGSIAALELGNEPELYRSFPWYKTAGGTKVPGRPQSYTFDSFLKDYATVVAALPRLPLAGPSSGSAAYLAGLDQFLASEPRVRVVTIHAYPLKYCVASIHPTIAQLLAPGAAQALTDQAAALAAVARRHHLALRMDELGSVSCGGYPPVTYSFAAALWALDQLFELDRAGLGGVNFVTSSNTVQHLIAVRRAGGSWTDTVLPEYYGLLAFARAAPPGSRALRIAGSLPPGVDAWATAAPGGRLHVVLVNAGSRPRTFALRISGASGPATLERLTAPDLAARSGVALGGQTISPSTGLLTGTARVATVAPAAGAYSVRVGGASAALLSLRG